MSGESVRTAGRRYLPLRRTALQLGCPHGLNRVIQLAIHEWPMGHQADRGWWQLAYEPANVGLHADDLA